MESFKDACDAGIINWLHNEIYRKDFHVTVFKDGKDVYQFCPEYNTPEVIQDAREDAHREGKRQVVSGYGKEYFIENVLGYPWPHIVLIVAPK
jgi:hypothetical protein